MSDTELYVSFQLVPTVSQQDNSYYYAYFTTRKLGFRKKSLSTVTQPVNRKIRIEPVSFCKPTDLITRFCYTSKIKAERSYTHVCPWFGDAPRPPDSLLFVSVLTEFLKWELAWLGKGLGYSVAHSKGKDADTCGVLLWFGILSFVFLFHFPCFGVGRVGGYVFQPTCITSYLQEPENKRLENWSTQVFWKTKATKTSSDV